MVKTLQTLPSSLRIQAKGLMVAYEALRDYSIPSAPPPRSPASLSLTHSSLATVASPLLLEDSKHSSMSEPMNLLFCLLPSFFESVMSGSGISLVLYINSTFLVTGPLITLPKKYPALLPLPGCIFIYTTSLHLIQRSADISVKADTSYVLFLANVLHLQCSTNVSFKCSTLALWHKTAKDKRGMGECKLCSETTV